MDLFRAIILGIIQGITEPLPISSSGHLILTPWLLGWPEHSLAFDAALHGGTALALIVYFWKQWISLAGAFFASLRERNVTRDYQRRLVWYIILASIPGALAGVLFEDQIEALLRTPWMVATLLMLVALILLLADSISSRRRSLSEVRLLDALIIGTAQALALAPGVSRSGATITAGLLLQMSRADAARFSFLMAGPITAGAACYKLLGLVREGFPPEEILPFAVGMSVAAVVGYAAIRFLLSYLQKHSLLVFVLYRLAFGTLALTMYLFR